MAATTAIATTAQPSAVTGPRPHPIRRGPNHALRPTSGFVRTLEVSPIAGECQSGLGWPLRVTRVTSFRPMSSAVPRRYT
jgi:hypothetical protein